MDIHSHLYLLINDTWAPFLHLTVLITAMWYPLWTYTMSTVHRNPQLYIVNLIRRLKTSPLKQLDPIYVWHCKCCLFQSKMRRNLRSQIFPLFYFADFFVTLRKYTICFRYIFIQYKYWRLIECHIEKCLFVSKLIFI